MNSQIQRILVVALPIVAAVGAGFIAVPGYLRLRDDTEALAQTRREIADKIPSIELLRNAPKGPPFAHVPATRNEPIEFLSHLNYVSRQCGVRLVRYTQVVEPKTEPTPPPPVSPDGSLPAVAKKENAEGVPEGIDQARLNLSVEGPYANMALFFGRLETYPRLVSISNVTMKSVKLPLITAEFTLTRYTTPEEDRAEPGKTAAP